MKNWRPENWEDNKFHRCMELTGGGGSYGDIYEVFEAGADQILEALKSNPVFRNYAGQVTASQPDVLSVLVPNKKGCIVFIPDKVKEE